MSGVVEQGFIVSYEVSNMKQIRPSGGGTLDNGHPYDSSVKFVVENLTEVEDEVLGIKDVTEMVEFKIITTNAEESAQLNKLLRQLKSQGVYIKLTGNLPRKFQNNPYPAVTVNEIGKQIIDAFSTKEKKAS